MGKAAVALLVNQMEERVSVDPEELLFEPELVVRGSTGPAPAHAQLPPDVTVSAG
jgi:DNA-binding LacI/PurR family transcriptional regulator